MSKSRTKKKRRRRARAASGGGSPTERPHVGRPVDDAPAHATASPRNPSRLEVRDGVPRPDAIWAPFPLTEIGMAVGIVLFLLGFAGAPGLLLAGIGVLVVVVAELCLREHFGGFRSHSILLALLPVTVVHLAVVLLVSEDWRGPPALLADLVVAGPLAWWLQRSFRRAQNRARR